MNKIERMCEELIFLLMQCDPETLMEVKQEWAEQLKGRVNERIQRYCADVTDAVIAYKKKELMDGTRQKKEE